MAILGPLIPLVLHWLLVTSFKVILLDREKCLLVVAVINVGFALGRLFEFAGFRWLEKDVTILLIGVQVLGELHFVEGRYADFILHRQSVRQGDFLAMSSWCRGTEQGSALIMPWSP